MQHLKGSVFVLCINLTIVITSYCQNNEYNLIVKSIANKVEKILNQKYYISGIDIDKSINNPTEANGKITDPYRTLTGCFLFLAEGQESESRGFIGLYRTKTDSIIWQSVLLSDDFSSAHGRIAETTELNKDSKVEIIIAQGKEPVMTEQLWIFSWDGTEGKLITQLDKYGESTVMEFGESYELKDIDGDGIYEIRGEWYKSSNSSSKTMVTYAWNGSLYGKWGKSSKYLLRKKHK
jgi:hypothetical protein